MRKAVAVFLIICLCSMVTAFEGGSGTTDDPYQISTCSQLQSINDSLSSHYELVSDVDCSNNLIEPIGTGTTNGFQGSLDGNYHTVSNLNLSHDGTVEVGLFSHMDSSVTGNLTLKNVYVEGNHELGSLVGDAITAEFYNIKVENSEIYNYGSSTGTGVGGLIGRTSYGNTNIANNITINNLTIDVATSNYGIGGLSGADNWAGNIDATDIEIYNSHIEERENDAYGIGQIETYKNGGDLVKDVEIVNTTIIAASAAAGAAVQGDDVHVENSVITGDGSAAAGAVREYGSNLTVVGSVINGSAGTIGGVAGESTAGVSHSYDVSNNLFIKDTRVEGGSQIVGGLVGYYDPYSSDTVGPNATDYSMDNVTVTPGSTSYRGAVMGRIGDYIYVQNGFMNNIAGDLIGHDFDSGGYTVNELYHNADTSNINTPLSSSTGVTTTDVIGSNAEGNMSFLPKGNWKTDPYGYPYPSNWDDKVPQLDIDAPSYNENLGPSYTEYEYVVNITDDSVFGFDFISDDTVIGEDQYTNTGSLESFSYIDSFDAGNSYNWRFETDVYETLLHPFSIESSQITEELLGPSNDTSYAYSDRNITFESNMTSNEDTTVRLVIDGNTVYTDENPADTTNQYSHTEEVSSGNHTWYYEYEGKSTGNIVQSETREFSVETPPRPYVMNRELTLNSSGGLVAEVQFDHGTGLDYVEGFSTSPSSGVVSINSDTITIEPENGEININSKLVDNQSETSNETVDIAVSQYEFKKHVQNQNKQSTTANQYVSTSVNMTVDSVNSFNFVETFEKPGNLTEELDSNVIDQQLTTGNNLIKTDWKVDMIDVSSEPMVQSTNYDSTSNTQYIEREQTLTHTGSSTTFDTVYPDSSALPGSCNNCDELNMDLSPGNDYIAIFEGSGQYLNTSELSSKYGDGSGVVPLESYDVTRTVEINNTLGIALENLDNSGAGLADCTLEDGSSFNISAGASKELDENLSCSSGSIGSPSEDVVSYENVSEVTETIQLDVSNDNINDKEINLTYDTSNFFGFDQRNTSISYSIDDKTSSQRFSVADDNSSIEHVVETDFGTSSLSAGTYTVKLVYNTTKEYTEDSDGGFVGGGSTGGTSTDDSEETDEPESTGEKKSVLDRVRGFFDSIGKSIGNFSVFGGGEETNQSDTDETVEDSQDQTGTSEEENQFNGEDGGNQEIQLGFVDRMILSISGIF